MARFLKIFFTTFLLAITLAKSSPLPPETATPTTITSTSCKKREHFHPGTSQCYRDRTKGPCTGNMVFTKVDKINGECGCPKDGPLPWVYHPETRGCYEAFKQAYCPTPSHWLTFDDGGNPVCAENPCRDAMSSEIVVPLRGECASLNKPSKLCDDEEEVVIRPGSNKVECVSSSISGQSLTSTAKLKCPLGFKRDGGGVCRRAVTILTGDEEE